MKQIWKLYIAPLLLLSIIFTVSQVKNYQDTKREVTLESGYYNRLFAGAMHSSLHEMELLLDILGAELLLDNIYLDPSKSPRTMNEMLSRNSSLVGFGLTDTEGNYIALSNNIDASRVKGLKEEEKTRASFLETLESNAMVIGPVYHFRGRNKWILPLRKALRDDSGKTLGVMTTGLAIDSATNFWKEKPLFPGQQSILIKDIGLWRIYVNPIEPAQYKSTYTTPLPVDIFKGAIESEINQSETSKQQIHTQGVPLQYQGAIPGSNQQSTITIEYNKRYKTWAMTAVPTSTVHVLFWNNFLQNLLAFVGVLALFLFLFGKIYKKEKTVRRNLAFQARHDSLTLLLNRSAQNGVFRQWIQPENPNFSIYYIDLDNFKHINDTYGHTGGDKILIEVAHRLKAISPEYSVILRNGGDEFSIFTKVYNYDPATELAEKIIHTISEPYNISGMHIYLGVSVGISQYPKDGTTKDELMVSADLALYDAKMKRNSYSFFNPELKKAMQRKTIVERHLRDACSRDDIYMVYQPQITNSGVIYGIEALARWNCPTLGTISPEIFIPIAENSGLMPQLGEHILEKSISDFAHICSCLNTDTSKLSLSINISVRQILEHNFKANLQEILTRHHLDISNITLEITESLFIERLDYILPLLRHTQQLGFTISLDDFGTGYSSLNMLRTLPINELKIDKSFVDNITDIDQDAAMLKSIINMGHTMGMSILAEGVENKKQFEILGTYGCDIYQGNYFASALTVKEFIRFFETKNTQPLLDRKQAGG